MKLRGRVEEGSRTGRKIGFPTANIAADGSFDVPDGVYAAVVAAEGRRFGAMANLGVKPTVEKNGRRVLELHLLGFDGDLYGQELEAELLEFIRPEREFASLEELRRQIEKDRETILKILKERKCI